MFKNIDLVCLAACYKAIRTVYGPVTAWRWLTDKFNSLGPSPNGAQSVLDNIRF